MGIHAAYTLIFTDVEFSLATMLTYLPVSLLYISSMTIGYVGLRFIELSISSPICNSSGALVSIICIIAGMASLVKAQYIAIALVTVGVVGLGVAEMTEDDELRAARQSKSNYKYAKSFLAILLPVIYSLLDALGTFADSLVLERLDEDAANTAYELTFLICGILCFIYVKFIKKDKFLPKETPKYIGAAFETAGQFAYICPCRQRACRSLRPDHLLILRRFGSLGKNFPQRKAFMEALLVHSSYRRRHRNNGNI